MNCLPFTSFWVHPWYLLGSVLSPQFSVCLSDVRVVHVVNFHVFTFVVPCCDVRYNFHVKKMLYSYCLPFVLLRIHVLFVCIYANWCPTRFTYQMMFVSYNSNMMGVTNEAETAKSWPKVVHEFQKKIRFHYEMSCSCVVGSSLFLVWLFMNFNKK